MRRFTKGAALAVGTALVAGMLTTSAHAATAALDPIVMTWAGDGTAIELDVNLFGAARTIVPGDSDTTSIKVVNAGPNAAMLSAYIVEADFGPTGDNEDGDDVHRHIFINDVELTDLLPTGDGTPGDGMTAVIEPVAIERDGTVELEFDWAFDPADEGLTPGNAAIAGPQQASFRLLLRLDGALPEVGLEVDKFWVLHTGGGLPDFQIAYPGFERLGFLQRGDGVEFFQPADEGTPDAELIAGEWWVEGAWPPGFASVGGAGGVEAAVASWANLHVRGPEAGTFTPSPWGEVEGPWSLLDEVTLAESWGELPTLCEPGDTFWWVDGEPFEGDVVETDEPQLSDAAVVTLDSWEDADDMTTRVLVENHVACFTLLTAFKTVEGAAHDVYAPFAAPAADAGLLTEDNLLRPTTWAGAVLGVHGPGEAVTAWAVDSGAGALVGEAVIPHIPVRPFSPYLLATGVAEDLAAGIEQIAVTYRLSGTETFAGAGYDWLQDPGVLAALEDNHLHTADIGEKICYLAADLSGTPLVPFTEVPQQRDGTIEIPFGEHVVCEVASRVSYLTGRKIVLDADGNVRDALPEGATFDPDAPEFANNWSMRVTPADDLAASRIRAGSGLDDLQTFTGPGRSWQDPSFVKLRPGHPHTVDLIVENPDAVEGYELVGLFYELVPSEGVRESVSNLGAVLDGNIESARQAAAAQGIAPVAFASFDAALEADAVAADVFAAPAFGPTAFAASPFAGGAEAILGTAATRTIVGRDVPMTEVARNADGTVSASFQIDGLQELDSLVITWVSAPIGAAIEDPVAAIPPIQRPTAPGLPALTGGFTPDGAPLWMFAAIIVLAAGAAVTGRKALAPARAKAQRR